MGKERTHPAPAENGKAKVGNRPDNGQNVRL